MKRLKVIVPLALTFAAATISGAAAPASAQARQSTSGGTHAPAFKICKVDESIPDGRYEINNNNFGGTRECLTGTRGKPSFRVSVSGASSNSPGSDAYPDIFAGCSWGVCSPHSWLPDKVAALGDPTTTFVGAERAGGTWGAAYDMFFDQRPIHDGQAQAESMIWLNSRNAYNPAGKGWPAVRLDGVLWWVLSWETTNGRQYWRYVQFRRERPTYHVTNLPLGPFIVYLKQKHLIQPDWYLLNVEAGFEIWNGGTGLAATRFSLRP